MILVAIAGWSIPRTSAKAFPVAGTHLHRYSGVFGGVEINSSFYRPHSRDTYAGWARQTPSAFRFSVKLPRAVTHEGRLRAARAPLKDFLASLSGLGRRLGPLVVQLPPSLIFDRRVVRAFFGLLREHHAGLVACEPRHPSWYDGKVDELLASYRVSRIAADPAVVPEAALPGGWPGLVYYRLHGTPRKYWSVYDAEQIRNWTSQLRSVAAQTPTWCVLDNTAAGGAAANALLMLRLLSRSVANRRKSRRAS